MYLNSREGRIKRNLDGFQALDETVQERLKISYPRKEITQQEQIDSWSSVDSIVDTANKLAQKFKKKRKDVRIDLYVEEDYGSQYARANLEVEGLETDEQYHARLFELNDALQAREDYERKEFERLKSKFGP